MGGIEGFNKESYERPEVELRLDEQISTPNYKTINDFQFDNNAMYFHVMERKPKVNEPGFEEKLQGIVELKKVNGNVIPSYLKYGATRGKPQNKQEGRSIDPQGIPNSLTVMVQHKIKEVDTIPGNPDQATTIDVFADEEMLVGETKKELGTLYKEVSNDIPN